MPARRPATQAVCCATEAGAGWRRRDDGRQGAGEGGRGGDVGLFAGMATNPTEWVSVDARAAGAHNLWPMCLTLRRPSRHCCGRSSFLPTTTIPSPPMSRPSSVASSTTTMYRPKKRYADPSPSPHRHRCSPPSLGRSNASSSPGPSRSLVFLIHSLPLSLTRVDRLSAN